MSTASSVSREPAIPVQPRSGYRVSRLVWSLPFSASVFFVGLLVLVFSGNLLLPFQRVTTVEGLMASKGAFFEDKEVRRILLRHRIRVHVTRFGSRELSRHDLGKYDFAFPSGSPAADLVRQDLDRKNRSYLLADPFILTPVVFATYREYAEALRGAGPCGEGSSSRPRAPAEPSNLSTARHLMT